MQSAESFVKRPRLLVATLLQMYYLYDMGIISNTVKTPEDFRKRFLSRPDEVFCDAKDVAPYQTSEGFFEIAPLKTMKRLFKKESFEPGRRQFYTIVLLTSGNARETIGHNTHSFGAGTLYFIAENQLHGLQSWSEDINGYHCIFDSDYFLLCLKNQVKLAHYPFFQLFKKPYIVLNEAEMEKIEQLFKKLSVEFCKKRGFNDDLLIRLYLNALLIEAERIYLSQRNIEEQQLSRKEQLAAGFRRLVSKHFIEYKKVSDYARFLYVNSHYLNDTIKEVTGNAASSFIHQQIIAEAKAQLIQSSDSIAVISANLNFIDQSYFSRFFKKHAGLSPQQFRQEQGH
jgi:AraC-like DNA-binding protein